VDANSVLEQQPNYENAKKAFDSMVTLNRAETTVIFHPLFTSYGFCQPAEYSMPQQIEARRQVLQYLEDNCLYGEKERIISESLHFSSRITAPAEGRTIVITNVTMGPTVVVYNGTRNQNESNAIRDSNCCLNGICSIGGFEQFEGICWQWWIVLVIFLMIYILILFAGRE
jgi:hypothetical protein